MARTRQGGLHIYSVAARREVTERWAREREQREGEQREGEEQRQAQQAELNAEADRLLQAFTETEAADRTEVDAWHTDEEQQEADNGPLAQRIVWRELTGEPRLSGSALYRSHLRSLQRQPGTRDRLNVDADATRAELDEFCPLLPPEHEPAGARLSWRANTRTTPAAQDQQGPEIAAQELERNTRELEEARRMAEHYEAMVRQQHAAQAAAGLVTEHRRQMAYRTGSPATHVPPPPPPPPPLRRELPHQASVRVRGREEFEADAAEAIYRRPRRSSFMGWETRRLAGGSDEEPESLVSDDVSSDDDAEEEEDHLELELGPATAGDGGAIAFEATAIALANQTRLLRSRPLRLRMLQQEQLQRARDRQGARLEQDQAQREQLLETLHRLASRRVAEQPPASYAPPGGCSFLTVGQRYSGGQHLSHPAGQQAVGYQGAEDWEVNVSIQGVDLSKGYVCGTMEAANVPNTTSPVSTFWEGEIVDNTNHTFYTRGWGAGRESDVAHWRMFQGFADIRPQVVRNNGKCPTLDSHPYLFMRWKEQFFVGPSRDCSLTIAGFYYVCLCRATGQLSGYYYDAASTPYQELHLSPVGGEAGHTFGSYSFR